MHSTRRCIEPGSGPTSYTNGRQGALHNHSGKCLTIVFLDQMLRLLFISSEAIGQCLFV